MGRRGGHLPSVGVSAAEGLQAHYNTHPCSWQQCAANMLWSCMVVMLQCSLHCNQVVTICVGASATAGLHAHYTANIGRW